jgi:hypothetical protein
MIGGVSVRRSSLSPSERRRRSRLTQLIQGHPFLRGTLSVRSRTCGKPNCRCARGELHVSLYVVQSHDGKPRQVYVPQEWEGPIRQAVQNHQEIQTLIEELSEMEWKRLRERKG